MDQANVIKPMVSTIGPTTGMVSKAAVVSMPPFKPDIFSGFFKIEVTKTNPVKAQTMIVSQKTPDMEIKA